MESEGKLPQPDNADEATPLLGNQSSNYRSTDDIKPRFTVSEDDLESRLPSRGYALEDDAALVTLAKVSSIPQGLDIEPDLERIFPTTSATDDAGGSTNEDTSYAARFLNVSPMRFWLIFSGVLLGYVIGFFDSTLMASSHPVITSHFHASNSASWLSTAFLLTSTAFMPLFGRVSDTFGRRPVYLFSIFVFFVTTAWCAMAQSIGSFIAARALCGLGAGGVTSLGMIISSDLVRIEYRGVYQSYINLSLGVGGSLGLSLGGFLCDQVGWRGAFYVQLPFIFVYFIVTAWTVPADLGIKMVGSGRMTIIQLLRSVDLTGSCLLIIGVTALIAGLNLGGNVFSWSHPLVISSLILSAIFAVLFVKYERHVERAVMPISLLTKNPRASLIFGNFFGAIAVNTAFFNAPLYFQAVKLATPTESGLRLIAPSLAVTMSSVGTGFLITRTRRCKPTIVLGGFLLVLGGIATATIGADTPDWLAMLSLSFAPLGQGFSFPSLMISVLATSEQDEQAVSTTTLGLFRNLGTVLGVSISSWILQNSLVLELERMVTGPEKQDIILLVRKSVRAIAELDPLHKQQVIEAYAASLRITLGSVALWASFMFLLHFRLRLPVLGSKRT
ncbi:hypothetical protein ASPZODRAFT_11694 [Penicilliopsis zonata CBS 506.65]|uniref:Major facilitator superfamily (MFS) profile domain-containing protein n=1 Tax=Penicilliopsis zonata CBS 506.65 TaxID=1073090 RepID=A0A1L9SUH1_9EURO|nr:hypothetical protein ASPZODRAFT_11694 [Penicilliopsis zonata CBS 506.65]OJJ50848.1 hypothetical protein ASPZODRAFT_11694 [Penicilliopsis zonata CBS 506.65]